MEMGFQWATWTAFDRSESYGFVCGWKRSESPTFWARFTPPAMRAAKLLDPRPGKQLVRWLEALRIERPEALEQKDLSITLTYEDGRSIKIPATEYGNLATASADLCNIFEARAYEIESRTETEEQVVEQVASPTVASLTPLPHDCKTIRRAQVEAFLQECNKLSPKRIYKRHIWLSVEHQKGRQFEYWQECSSKATREDHVTLPEPISMKPQDFLALLHRKKLLPEE